MTSPLPGSLRRRASRWAVGLSALGFGAWWLMSVVFHAAFFGAVYVAAPAEKAAEDEAEFSMRISPGRVREVVAEIRQEETQRFKERVEELLQIKRELDQLNADKIAQYNEIIQGEAPRAREKLPAAFDNAVAAQKAALTAQESACEALSAFGAGQSEAALQAVLTAQAAAGQAQNQAEQAQAEVATQLRLAAVAPAALAAHEGAANAQCEATAAQAALTGGIRQVDVARRSLTSSEEAAARQQTALDQHADRVATAQGRLSVIQQTLDDAREKVETARAAVTARAEAATAATAATPAEKKRLADASRQAVAALKREELVFNRADQAAIQAEGVLKRIEAAAAGQQKRAAEAHALVKTRTQIVTDAVAATAADAAKRQQDSITVQRASLRLQETANAAIAQAITAARAANTSANPAAARPTQVAAPDIADARTLADFFRQAQEAEVAVAETFKNVRAAELAAIRKIPLADALAMTKVATPERQTLDTEILGSDISDVKGVRRQEKAIGAASDQMASMVALAQRMRELAAGAGANLSVAEIQVQGEHAARMEQLAREDSGARAKDLSGEMAAAHGAHGADSAQGESGDQGDGKGRGAGGVSADYSQRTPGTAPDVRTIAVKNYKPLHGRTVRQGMVAIEPGRNPAWLYVDTWHLIGPWPNSGRKNLNTKFPPETVVNLDAVYQGARKNEVPVPVRWEFFQMPTKVTGKENAPAVPMIMPPGLGDYEIYYAYTELWFDEAADLWVAIGSDDQSKVWINDLLIWKSGDAHKSWVANEGLRKVHFRKGVNRVLYRLENGQNSGGFSFIVCLSADAVAGP